MIVFGVDPGTVVLGYGVVATAGRGNRALDYGVIRAPRRGGLDYADRLRRIADGLAEQLDRFPVDVLALEEAFFGKSVQSALRIGEARGIVLLAAARAGIPVAQYTPATIKKAVTGKGGAAKEQVQEMVRLSLGLATRPAPADAADALAIALCHLVRGEHLGRLGLA